MKAILVICHETSRSGASLVLLAYLRWLKTRSDDTYALHILIKRSSELDDDFAKFGKLYHLQHPRARSNRLTSRLFRRLIDRPILQERRLIKWVTHWKSLSIETIYNNTATNGNILRHLHSLGCPIISHIHETEYSLERFANPQGIAATLNLSSRLIAVSNEVKNDLINHYRVSEYRIQIIKNPIVHDWDRKAANDPISTTLNDLPFDTKIVGTCANVDRLKGPDLFIEVAKRTVETYSGNIVFVWIGGGDYKTYADQMLQQKLDQKIRFIGPCDNPLPYLSQLDVYVLTSRVESFGLTLLEAASLSKPIVAFDDSGGPKEFLADNCGILIPHLDCDAMSQAIVELFGNEERSQTLGNNCHTRLLSEHTIDHLGSQLESVLRGQNQTTITESTGTESSNPKELVCAVVVLYNPPAASIANIEALLDQFSTVTLVSNGISREFEDALLPLRGDHCHILRNTSNVGIAKALNQGFDHARRLGFEWAVSFDQDSIPTVGFLDALWRTYEQSIATNTPAALVGPNIVDLATPDASYKWLCQWKGLPFLYRRIGCYLGDLKNVSVAITSGSLTNLRIHQDIGGFREDFFIDYVDTEYCLRLKQNGYAIVVCAKALLHHRLGERKSFSALGHEFRPTFHSPVRLYYIFRNRIPMLRAYSFRYPHWFFFDTVAAVYNLLRITLFEDCKGSKLKSCLKGTWAGLIGKSGPISPLNGDTNV